MCLTSSWLSSSAKSIVAMMAIRRESERRACAEGPSRMPSRRCCLRRDPLVRGDLGPVPLGYADRGQRRAGGRPAIVVGNGNLNQEKERLGLREEVLLDSTMIALTCWVSATRTFESVPCPSGAVAPSLETFTYGSGWPRGAG